MKPVLLLDVVALTPAQLGADTPHLNALAEGGAAAPMGELLPGLTCSSQATLLTGLAPGEHGAVANGWFTRDIAEVALWRQSNALVSGEKLYEAARRRDPSFTCAKLFWWWNMGAAVDYSITPRPHYAADGLKHLDVYGKPDEWVAQLKRTHGPFPFFDFWGPRAGLPSSRWIADVALSTLRHQRPDLTLVYLPHLDYDHQRLGPRAAASVQALREVDALVGELAAGAREVGAEVVVVSEYGIEEVERPVYLNRVLREVGLLEVRPGPVGEVLDVFASRAFAVCDHQVAHVYVRDPADRDPAAERLAGLDGVARVLAGDELAAAGLDHPRSGDLFVEATAGAWFPYNYWLDDGRAPDFARTVDIHRKPGYDPCELFVDPGIRLPKLRVARRLARKFLGLRYLMDLIPLDASLVRGSHGRLFGEPQHGPVFLCSRPFGECGPAPEDGVVPMGSVAARVLELLGRGSARIDPDSAPFA